MARVGQNRSRSIKWAAKQEKFQPKEMCFFLTPPFIELSELAELIGKSGDTLFCLFFSHQFLPQQTDNIVAGTPRNVSFNLVVRCAATIRYTEGFCAANPS
jgi:hypothetical protein